MTMKETLIQKIKNKTLTMGVCGLGYVGLPLAVDKAKHGFKTIGFDVQEQKVAMVNAGKNPMFTQAERVDFIRRVTADIPNVEVDSSSMLLAEYAKAKGSCVIVKGLRAGSDFEYEFQMALINRKINPALDTMFLTAEHQYMYLSSSTVKELGSYGVDLSDFLPSEIIPDFQKKINEKRQGGNSK